MASIVLPNGQLMRNPEDLAEIARTRPVNVRRYVYLDEVAIGLAELRSEWEGAAANNPS